MAFGALEALAKDFEEPFNTAFFAAEVATSVPTNFAAVLSPSLVMTRAPAAPTAFTAPEIRGATIAAISLNLSRRRAQRCEKKPGFHRLTKAYITPWLHLATPLG